MFATILLIPIYVEIYRFVETFSQVDRILIELLTLIILKMAIWFIKYVFKSVRTLQCHTVYPFNILFYFWNIVQYLYNV